MPGVVWLASYPKSGNTWTRAFLANYLVDGAEPVDINKLPEFAFGDSKRRMYADFGQISNEKVTFAYALRNKAQMLSWLVHFRQSDVFVKTHCRLTTAHGVPTIPPSVTAGAIYIVRNPFDVAVSFMHHMQTTIDNAVLSLCTPGLTLPATDTHVDEFLGSWGQHVEGWTRAPGMTRHVMRYEDMVREPEAAFSALVRFLNLPLDSERLKKAVRFSDFQSLKSQERERGFVEARDDGKSPFFRSGQIGQWQESLSESHIRMIVESHRAILERFGYLDAEGRPASITYEPARRRQDAAAPGLIHDSV